LISIERFPLLILVIFEINHINAIGCNNVYLNRKLSIGTAEIDCTFGLLFF